MEIRTLGKALIAFSIAATAVLGQPAPSMAQDVPGQIDDGDCDDLLLSPPDDGEGGVAGIISGANTALTCDQNLRNHLTVVYLSDTIRQIVGGRLNSNSLCASVDDEDLSEDERRRREESCTTQAGLIITQTGAPVQKRFNAWIDSKTTWIEAGNKDVSPTDGPAINASGGIDYRINDRVILGLLGSFEHSNLDTGGFIPSTTKTEGFGGGAYLGVTVTPNIVFSGMVTGTAIKTDLDYDFVAASLDSTRLQASGSFTGYWYFQTMRLSPSVTLAWSKEWQDAFTDNLGFPGPAQRYESAVLTIGNQIGRTYALTSGDTIEPWGGAQFDWTFLSNVDIDGFGETKYQDSYDLRVQAGFNYVFAGGGQLAVTGEIGGLAMPDNSTYSGEVNYSLQF